MKRVLTTPASAELKVLQNLLQQAGIPCVIRNEELASLLGTTPFNAELWVERDEDFGPAHELYRTWCMPAIQTDSSWTCHVCGQSVEAQFDSCWKCATPRPELALGEFPASCDEAIHRAEEMTSLLDGILHQSDRCRLGQASLPRNSF
ncbi:MAG: DUF2007 domain-containing protein [Verrucomicrobiota bacterium]